MAFPEGVWQHVAGHPQTGKACWNLAQLLPVFLLDSLTLCAVPPHNLVTSCLGGWKGSNS